MNTGKVNRKEFLRNGAAMAAGTMLLELTPCCSGKCHAATETPAERLSMRPYQVLCMTCHLGEHGAGPKEGKLAELFQAIQKQPDRPITLVCNAGDVYGYQEPGIAEDTPEGRDFNRKRDLDILQRMHWAPGMTLPARAIFNSVLKQITSVAGICRNEGSTCDAWKGCPKAAGGCYEKGRKLGIKALVPPRSEVEMKAEKEKSIAAMNAAEVVTIRPHILLCAVCQYGGGTRPPFKEDNLPELLRMILNGKPDILIRMARQADWMMCAPCPHRAPGLNACVNVLGSGGLSNEKRDLDMLQVLGLEFGSTMKARDLYRLIFEKIPTTQAICKRDNVSPAVWWDGCGESNMKKGNANYEKGRQELREKLGLVEKPAR